MRFDTNKVIITGKIQKIEPITTKKLKKAVNILVTTENKYADVSQCQAYGELADLIEQNYSIDTSVIIIGRLRSVPMKDSTKTSNWVVIEKIGEELIVTENGRDSEAIGV